MLCYSLRACMNRKRIGSITVAGGSSMEKAGKLKTFHRHYVRVLKGGRGGGGVTSPISQPIFFSKSYFPVLKSHSQYYGF